MNMKPTTEIKIKTIIDIIEALPQEKQEESFGIIKEIQCKSNWINVDINKIDWIGVSYNEKKNTVSHKLFAPKLARFIKNNVKYIFARNDSNSQVMRYFYEDGYYKKINDDELKSYIKDLIPLFMEKKHDINEVFTLLTFDRVFKNIDELNDNENIINFKNGLLYLDTMELKPHTPDVLSTIQIPCNYNVDATMPDNSVFESFINYLTDYDTEVKSLLLQFLGYSISNVKGFKSKKALFMQGKGDTGKSQLKKLAERLIGKDNSTAIELEKLEARFGTATIYNKRLAGSNDMSYATVKELKALKQGTGGDTMTAEFKCQQQFDFIYGGLFWFCCNKMPKFGGDKGDWVYERIMIVECNNVVAVKDQNPNIVDDMLKESEYIVNLAIKELKRVLDNRCKFIIPDKCLLAREQYKVENNSFLTFVNECTTKRGKGYDNCTTKVFYDIYVEWCKENNNGYSEKKKDIKQYMYELTGTKKEEQLIGKSGGKQYYKDYTLNQDTINDYRKLYGNDSITTVTPSTYNYS